MKRFKLSAVRHLLNAGLLNDDEVYIYLLSFAADAVCLLIHSYLLVLNIVFRIDFLIMMNIISVATYLFSLVFVRRRQYTLLCMIVAIEVVIYTTISNIYCGIETYTLVYYVLIIGFFGMVSFGTRKLGLIVRSLCAVSAGISLYFHFTTAPMVTVSRAYYIVMLTSNVYIMLFGIAVEFYIVNFAKEIIRSLNEERIEELSSQAYQEPLTGLYNRRYARIYFDNLPAISGSCCVAMLDIDDFKHINDTMGHGSGDDVLVFLAGFLKSHLRKSDEAFRWGGEEFLLVLTNTRPQEACRALDKLRQQLAETRIATRNGEISVTVTIGIANLDFRNVEGSIEQSDERLYRGKRDGKNRVVL